MSSRTQTQRFHTLDLLRGFFIVIIIVDHLSRWPSVFEFISGRALLWVTAAEGFVIISGLLVGFIRGRKDSQRSFKEVTLTLWRRALTLYIWAVIGSIVYTVALWYIPLTGGAPGLPYQRGDWGGLIVDSLALSYTFVWIYFLKLYALFLAAAPLAIWLLRKGKAWLVALLSLGLLMVGWALQDEALQWQFVFFIPVIAGYYMPAIQAWWKRHTSTRRTVITASVIGLTIVTIIFSVISTALPGISTILDRTTAHLFAKDTMGLLRALVAFLWFTGYLFIFNIFAPQIERLFGWLLRPIGTHSLTAYIVHGVAIIIISFLFVSSDDTILNSLFGAIAILIVWGILKIPHINRVIPR
jgi:hypothetical protein